MLYTAGLATLLAAWLGLSCLAQLDVVSSRVRKLLRIEAVGIWLPWYHFFAPEPGAADVHLLYRITSVGDGPWHEVTLCPARTWTHAVWNPHRRHLKMLWDISNSLAVHHPVATGLPPGYMLLLHYVARHVRTAHPDTTNLSIQFALAGTGLRHPREDPQILFVSHQHRVPDNLARSGR
ncbi:hypothetical protein [Streptomyces sp. NPDC002088]|uniref:hypothetical protein n=1 Tax=Streptomyces sp. NPDC002088 TaxID=3154665 RepID=UPI00331CD8A2